MRGKSVSRDMDEVHRAYQLGVQIKYGLFYKFTGFREQDENSLKTFFQKNFAIKPEKKQLSVCGHNWGEVDLSGEKQAFEVSLADVARTQLQGKTDVVLEFHMDDTISENEKDSLMEISFHIPNSSSQYGGDVTRPSAQVFRDKITSMADVSASGEDAVVTFESISVITPRGRYSVELHLSFFRLQGQANDFKIQYSSVIRLFLLPKSNRQHTFVVVTVYPPIRKGQTLYPHIVLQFETDFVVQSTLSMNEDLLNSNYKNRLEPSYNGLIHEVFTMILRGLSGAKVTRPGTFHSHQDEHAVKSSLKAEDGLLYPLEKGFFFLPKRPTLILNNGIDYVEFISHGARGTTMHYFDLLVKLKSGQEHKFLNIQRNEHDNLFNFISGKGLKIMDLGDVHAVAAVLLNDVNDAVDPHLEQIRNEDGADESDEEDEDFVMEKDDGGSPTDDSGGEDSDDSESGGEKGPVKKEEEKEFCVSKRSSSRNNSEYGDVKDGTKKKKI